MAGRVSTGQEELRALAVFAEHVPGAYLETPRPEQEQVHLARIVEAVRLNPVTAGDPVAAHGWAGSRRRRRNMLSTIFSTLAAKIAAVTVAAAAATGGLAATGNLPAPAQDAVATAMSHLGVHFPSAEEAGTDDAGTGEAATDANEHGKTVSETARTTDMTGREKGEEVSGVASTKSLEHRQDALHRQDGEQSSNNPTGNGSPTTPDGNPTGYGQDSHPSGNPTGNGQGSHPSGNPTGNGGPSHP
jgi:hypothetical protein